MCTKVLYDHCQISACFQNVYYLKESITEIETFENSKGFIWDENSEILFNKALCNLDKPLTDFVKSKFDCDASDIERARITLL